MEMTFVTPKPSRKAGTVRVCAGDESRAASPAASRPTCAHPGRCSCVDLVPSADRCLSPPGATAGPIHRPHFQLFEGPVHVLVSPKTGLKGPSGCAHGAGRTVLHPWREWEPRDSGASARGATTAPHLQKLLSKSRLKQPSSTPGTEQHRPPAAASRKNSPEFLWHCPLFPAREMLGLLLWAELEGNSFKDSPAGSWGQGPNAGLTVLWAEIWTHHSQPLLAPRVRIKHNKTQKP